MKQKLLKLWDRHGCEVCDVILWLSAIMAIVSAEMLVVAFFAVKYSIEEGDSIMIDWETIIRDFPTQLVLTGLVALVGSLVGGALSARFVVRKTMEDFTKVVSAELEKIHVHLQN